MSDRAKDFLLPLPDKRFLDSDAVKIDRAA
jgi:hypothetical protein